MTTRIEAAAIALASGYEDEAKYYTDEAQAALAAADAWEVERGIHKITLGSATVEMAARALATETFTRDSRWDELSTESRDWILEAARAVLAAAVGGDGE